MATSAEPGLERCPKTSRVAGEEQDPFLVEGIKYPGMNDVMLGRGGESTYHCGNIAFRQLVEAHKNKYYTAPRAGKSRVVAQLVREWRTMDPPGRFLARSQPGTGDDSSWYDVGDRRAIKKASHSLRDSVRCLSIEKKQREEEGEEQQQEQSGHRISVGDVSGKGHTICRKRGRAATNEVVPVLLVSSGIRDQKKNVAEVGVPTKKRRIVFDEREDIQDDHRIKGSEADYAGRDHRDECGRNGGEGFDATPFSISWPQPSWNNALTERISNGQERYRLESNASPCGSADWFSPAGMPVQRPSLALPTASVLVGEVDDPTMQEKTLRSDDDSLGWFSDQEGLASFLASPSSLVGFALHRPVAVTKSCGEDGSPSQGREL